MAIYPLMMISQKLGGVMSENDCTDGCINDEQIKKLIRVFIRATLRIYYDNRESVNENAQDSTQENDIPHIEPITIRAREVPRS